MALTRPPIAAEPLTYEDYLAEGEVMRRYDIVDGERHWMTNSARRHQRILQRILRLLQDYEIASGRGQVLVAPCDLLIQRAPLRTRQPDLLVISHERLAQCGPDTEPTPLLAAPELVVEILSPSDTRSQRDAKMEDYRAVGVIECWVVSPEAETVEVLRLTGDGTERVGIYGSGDLLRSGAFPELVVPIVSIFAA